MLTHSACPQTLCLSRRMDVKCVFPWVPVKFTSEETCQSFCLSSLLKQHQRTEQKSTQWIASAGWTVCHSFRTTSYCCDKVCVYTCTCVCGGVCQLDSKRLCAFVCICLMQASVCCHAGCPTTIDSEPIKKTACMCPNILAAHRTVWTPFCSDFVKYFPGSNTGEITKITNRASRGVFFIVQGFGDTPISMLYPPGHIKGFFTNPNHKNIFVNQE